MNKILSRGFQQQDGWAEERNSDNGNIEQWKLFNLNNREKSLGAGGPVGP